MEELRRLEDRLEFLIGLIPETDEEADELGELIDETEEEILSVGFIIAEEEYDQRIMQSWYGRGL